MCVWARKYYTCVCKQISLFLVCLSNLLSCVVILKISSKYKGIGLLSICERNHDNYVCSLFFLAFYICFISLTNSDSITLCFESDLKFLKRKKKKTQFILHSSVFLTFRNHMTKETYFLQPEITLGQLWIQLLLFQGLQLTTNQKIKRD